MLSKVKMGEFYPLGQSVLFYDKNTHRVTATGEFRPPRKGEWFLSGAVIEGYRANADLTTPYYIGVLVSGKMVTTWVPAD